MYYLYSTNDKPGAKLIRWGGGDKCSHFAMYFPKIGKVVESRMDIGVREIPIENWLTENRVIFAQKLKIETPDLKLYQLTRPIIGKRYDGKAILFLSLITLFKKIFSRLPFGENKWGAKDQYFCLEIVAVHKDVLEDNNCPLDYDIENLYPEEFYEILRECDFVEKVDPLAIGAK